MMNVEEALLLIEKGDYEPVLEAGTGHDGAALRAALAERARSVREEIYGKDVFVRGLIEISSFCKNDCHYCGLRASNKAAERYRLSPDEILACANEGYGLGFRTIVLQGGEDAFFTDDILCDIIRGIKRAHPDVAVTLSLGERGRESFARLREAGADRYLLRHETADEAHYAMLHPKSMSFANRMQSLRELRELGYQVGCGFMVGSPGQTFATLAKDLAFIASFRPEMCGIGPFVPHHATPYASYPAGSVELTCLLLSMIRIIHPRVLLPATTALGTIHPAGRELGFLAGANVIMPNLSPGDVRKKYLLYDGKICTEDEASACGRCIELRVRKAGCRVVYIRGDHVGFEVRSQEK